MRDRLIQWPWSSGHTGHWPWEPLSPSCMPGLGPDCGFPSVSQAPSQGQPRGAGGAEHNQEDGAGGCLEQEPSKALQLKGSRETCRETAVPPPPQLPHSGSGLGIPPAPHSAQAI